MGKPLLCAAAYLSADVLRSASWPSVACSPSVCSNAEPTEWSRSNSKSPVLFRPGVAFFNNKSVGVALWKYVPEPPENVVSAQLPPPSPTGTVVPSTIRASTFGPAFAGAMNLSWPWNLSSHCVVPAYVIGLLPCPMICNQSPFAVIPSLSNFAINELSHS